MKWSRFWILYIFSDTMQMQNDKYQTNSWLRLQNWDFTFAKSIINSRRPKCWLDIRTYKQYIKITVMFERIHVRSWVSVYFIFEMFTQNRQCVSTHVYKYKLIFLGIIGIGIFRFSMLFLSFLKVQLGNLWSVISKI